MALPSLIAEAGVVSTQVLDPLFSLLGQGAFVAFVLYWVTQRLIPRLQDDAKEARVQFTTELALQRQTTKELSDAIKDLAAATRAAAPPALNTTDRRVA